MVCTDHAGLIRSECDRGTFILPAEVVVCCTCFQAVVERIYNDSTKIRAAIVRAT